MILQKTAILGALLVAVRKGKKVQNVTKIDTDAKTVRDVTGKTYQVDFFVALKPPVFLHSKLEALGIEWTGDVAAYIKRKKRQLNQEKRRSKRKIKDEQAAA